jgi:hypothetical protein
VGPTLRTLRTVGPRQAVRIAANRAWSRHSSLGLRADLAELPERHVAKVDATMRPVDASTFDGFAGDDVELLQRRLLCEGGVRTLYVARSDAGEPIYAQWLVLPGDQDALRLATGGLYPELEPTEALIEGAYTFPAFRGLAVMADCMWQLFAAARDAGATSMLTYVSPDNVPSLRGCARAGFGLDHVRVEHRRAGRTSIERVAPDDAARTAWANATA